VNTSIWKVPPKLNEVKVDYIGQGLIVDGMPFLPNGFYLWYKTGSDSFMASEVLLLLLLLLLSASLYNQIDDEWSEHSDAIQRRTS
jgi:hypothetical protein